MLTKLKIHINHTTMKCPVVTTSQHCLYVLCVYFDFILCTYVFVYTNVSDITSLSPVILIPSLHHCFFL